MPIKEDDASTDNNSSGLSNLDVFNKGVSRLGVLIILSLISRSTIKVSIKRS